MCDQIVECHDVIGVVNFLTVVAAVVETHELVVIDEFGLVVQVKLQRAGHEGAIGQSPAANLSIENLREIVDCLNFNIYSSAL